MESRAVGVVGVGHLDLCPHLVGEVSAELLEIVDRKRLRAALVKQAHEGLRLVRVALDRHVDVRDDAIEEARADRLGQRVLTFYRRDCDVVMGSFGL